MHATGKAERFYRELASPAQQGKRLLLQAISLDKNFADDYALLAEFYGYQAANFAEDGAANIKRAEDAARNALRINSRSSEGLTALAFAYGEGGQEGDAIRTSRQAVGVAPNSAVAWETLGYSCYYAGLNELAEQAWGRVVTMNPTPQPHWMHARMLLYSGKAKDAEEEMRSVVAANPDQFKALAYLGMALYYEGKLDEAQTELDRAVTLGHDSEDDTPRLLAAFLYASRGRVGVGTVSYTHLDVYKRQLPQIWRIATKPTTTSEELSSWVRSDACLLYTSRCV